MARSESAGFQPVLDLRQAVGAKEGFAVDDHVRRPEDARSQCGIDFILEPRLDFRRLERGGECLSVNAELSGNVEHRVGRRNVEIVDKEAAIDCLGELASQPAVLAVQPVVGGAAFWVASGKRLGGL